MNEPRTPSDEVAQPEDERRLAGQDERRLAERAPSEDNAGLRPWRERLAGVVLLGGLAVAGVMLQRDWPRTHRIALRLEGPMSVVARVTSLDVVVLAVDSDVEPLLTFRRTFPAGAPRMIPIEIRTADYEVDIEVHTDLAGRTRSMRKRITLHPDEESAGVLVRVDDGDVEPVEPVESVKPVEPIDKDDREHR